jgi:FlaA1/EpsC-like NDP-sugar epimerase
LSLVQAERTVRTIYLEVSMMKRLRFKATEWLDLLLAQPRSVKRAILVACDVVMLTVVIFAIVWLRRFGIEDTTRGGLVLLAIAPIITVATFAWLGLYRLVTRFIGHHGHLRIASGVALATLVWALVVFMSGQQGVPRSAIMSYAAIGTISIIASRNGFTWLLKNSGVSAIIQLGEAPRKRVLIYGARSAGVRLLQAIRGAADHEPVGFIDPEPSLWGQYIDSLKVYRPEKMVRLIEARDVVEVLLALPASQRIERYRALDLLKGVPVIVKILPTLEDIASGHVTITDLREINVNDLLGREPVPPQSELLARDIKGKSVLVTGAGGSIGSELVRQILVQQPARLVLMDVSENALYNIEIEVQKLMGEAVDCASPNVLAVLGSILDQPLVMATLSDYRIQTVYHAAAYKHVPLVEANLIAGLANNVFGTSILAGCAQRAGVERFVLVSTDKAVRPTNVMGASKRLAELIIQGLAAEQQCVTIFTMVRFGNVLDSSGSVVELFRRQIADGGPVTVTHPEVTRYFMSIPEAAGLVLQAGAMATGGEVFLLEMGEPVKINELARLMIRLSGLEIRSLEQPHGDIEIVYKGLRPGEKLFEELLVGADTHPTQHPRIMRSREPFLPIADLAHELALLQIALQCRDLALIRATLLRTVEGYRPDTQLTAAN